MDMSYKVYTNIGLQLRNINHGPLYYKIGDTYVYNEHVF